MAYQDKFIKCSECGDTFTFSAGEQEFYSSKDFTNEPKRCSKCRAVRRHQRTREVDIGKSSAS